MLVEADSPPVWPPRLKDEKTEAEGGHREETGIPGGLVSSLAPFLPIISLLPINSTPMAPDARLSGLQDSVLLASSHLSSRFSRALGRTPTPGFTAPTPTAVCDMLLLASCCTRL